MLLNSIRSIGNALQPLFLLLVRVYWGAAFVLTGYGKLAHLDAIAAYFQSLGIPMPYFSAALTGFFELVCGALIFVGFWSRLAAIPLIVTLTMAYFTAERDSLAALSNWSFQPFFKATPFLFDCAAWIIFCFGPGKISLDWFLSKDKRAP